MEADGCLDIQIETFFFLIMEIVFKPRGGKGA